MVRAHGARRSTNRLVVALLVVGAAALTIGQQPANRLVNGGGESGEAGRAVDNGSACFELAAWTAREGRWLAQTDGWFEVRAVEGRRFLRPAPGPRAAAEQPVDVPPGARWAVLRAWQRGWGDGDQGTLLLRCADAAGQPLGEQAGDPIGGTRWTDAVVVAELPAGCARVTAVLRGERAAGNDCDAYFDDVRLYLLDQPPLLARIAVEPVPGAAPGTVRFRDASIGEPESREWSFGDGTTNGAAAPEHRYAPGEYRVALTVRGGGRSDRVELPEPLVVEPLRLIKGPYLQHVTADAVTVAWETNYPADSALLYTAADGVERLVEQAEPTTPHQVRLTGAAPFTRASYRVRSRAGAAEVRSETGTFKTAPPRETPVTLVAWGCNHVNPPVFGKLVHRMLGHQPDLAWALGDIVDTGADYAQWERGFFGPLRPLLLNVPLLVSIGNHEGNHPWFYRFLDQPGNEHYFGFDWANLHCTVVDSNVPFAPGSEQYRFIEQDLSSPAARAADFRIVGHHHPPWSEIYEEEHYARLREQLVPLYQRLGVDLLLTAHIHDYERGSVARPDGGTLWYVQTSGAGGRLWEDEFTGDWDAVAKVVQYKHHYSLLEIAGRQLRFRAIDLDGAAIDSFEASGRPLSGR